MSTSIVHKRQLLAIPVVGFPDASRQVSGQVRNDVYCYVVFCLFVLSSLSCIGSPCYISMLYLIFLCLFHLKQHKCAFNYYYYNYSFCGASKWCTNVRVYVKYQSPTVRCSAWATAVLTHTLVTHILVGDITTALVVTWEVFFSHYPLDC